MLHSDQPAPLRRKEDYFFLLLGAAFFAVGFLPATFFAAGFAATAFFFVAAFLVAILLLDNT